MATRVKPSTALKALSLAWLRDPATSEVFRDTVNDHLLYVFTAAWQRFAHLPRMRPQRQTLHNIRSERKALLPKDHVATDLQLKVAAASLVAFLEKNMDPAVKEKMIKNGIDLIHPDLQALADGDRLASAVRGAPSAPRSVLVFTAPRPATLQVHAASRLTAPPPSRPRRSARSKSRPPLQ